LPTNLISKSVTGDLPFPELKRFKDGIARRVGTDSGARAQIRIATNVTSDQKSMRRVEVTVCVELFA
jgi:hypothetical protein